tara:strand:- start:163 stop:447 length:285 start_codon:yes stop_codon:yes gene_type:complete
MAFTDKIGGGRSGGSGGSKGLGTGKKLTKEQRERYAMRKRVAWGGKELSKVLPLIGFSAFALNKAGKFVYDKVKEKIDSPTGAKTVFQNKEDKK